jgi:hypothetical protein
MSEPSPQKPVMEFRAGTIVASVWQERGGANGKSYPKFSVRIQKRYRDEKSGQWKTTTYFRPDELPKLELVAGKAYEHLTLRVMDTAETAEQR